MNNLIKFKLILAWGFRFLLVIASVWAIAAHDWLNLGFLGLTMFITFLPSIIQERMEIHYPSEFEIMILAFIFLSLYLGEVHSFYEQHAWWDIFLHGVSGVIIGGIGFSLVFVLNRAEKVALKLSPAFVAFFAFCFSMMIGSMWEIFEFFMDYYFGLNMQKSGLVDTMWDLVADAIGALVFSFIGYLHMKKEIGFFECLERKFFNLNPDLKKGR